MANETTAGVDYHLAVSMVRVAGTRSASMDAAVFPVAETEEADATVELVTVADHRFRFGIRNDGGWTRDVALELALTDDLRIVSTGATSKGRVGEAVKGTLRFVASTLATAATLAATGGAGGALRDTSKEPPPKPGPPTPPPPPRSAEQLYAETMKDAAVLRNSVRSALATVRGKLIEGELHLADAENPDDVRAAAQRSRARQAALGRLEELHAEAEARFQVWKASRRTTTTTEFEYLVAVADLPRTSDIDCHLEEPTEELLGSSWPLFRDLHCAVTVTDVSARKDATDIDPTVDRSYPGVFYRKPREVELSVYERDGGPGLADARLVLSRRTRHLVVDDHCERRYVQFDKSAWGDRAVKLEFGDLGAPTKVSTAATSTAAAVGGMLGELPAVVKDALAQGAAAAAQLEKIGDAGVDRQLARLDKRAQLLQRTIAEDAAGVDGKALRDLQALKQQKETLTLQKEIGALSRALAPSREVVPPAAPKGPVGRKVVITVDGDAVD